MCGGDSTRADLEGDGCSGVPASDTGKSPFNKLIRMSFLWITIAPRRIINVMSLDNQPQPLWFMSLQAEPAFDTRGIFTSPSSCPFKMHNGKTVFALRKLRTELQMNIVVILSP